MTVPFQSMLALTLGWLVLTGGAPDSWLIGGPVIVLVALAVQRWRPERAHSVRWRAVPSFTAFFFARSLAAGVDVARRTLLPAMPLSPAVVSYKTVLPSGAPQVFFAGVLSLLPGSLSVSIHDNIIAVHVLDDSSDTMSDLQQVEQRIAAIFGVANA